MHKKNHNNPKIGVVFYCEAVLYEKEIQSYQSSLVLNFALWCYIPPPPPPLPYFYTYFTDVEADSEVTSIHRKASLYKYTLCNERFAEVIIFQNLLFLSMPLPLTKIIFDCLNKISKLRDTRNIREKVACLYKYLYKSFELINL